MKRHPDLVPVLIKRPQDLIDLGAKMKEIVLDPEKCAHSLMPGLATRLITLREKGDSLR
jgi:hypothetical protein